MATNRQIVFADADQRDLTKLADVQVGLSYDFTYRPDAP